MVLMALFTTFITNPLVMAVYKPAKRAKKADYKHRIIERKDSSAQLRILACFHSTRSIPTLINLIEVSRGSERQQQLCIYAMHLMELSERSSAIRMVQKAKKNGLPFWNKGRQADSDHVVVAFNAFQQLSHVSIRPMTAISAMSTIHEDVCASAERKRVAMVIVPFHKHQRVDGTLETTRNDFMWINRRVLEMAPCSVGILVDRGFGGTTHVSASEVSSSIGVLFFGGRDNREAPAYGARMVEHPGINLKVLRFLMEPEPHGENVRIDVKSDSGNKSWSADDEFLADFRRKVKKNSLSVKYEEQTVRSGAKIIAKVREFNRCNLVLVGRMPEGLVAGALDGRNEFPELGPVGNLLASSDIYTTTSVLIVQQYYSRVSSEAPAISLEEGLPERDSQN